MWIFWFLAIASGICLITVIITLPETSRNVVGNGSARPFGWNALPFFLPWSPRTFEPVHRERRKLSRNDILLPRTCLNQLRQRDSACIVMTFGILYMTYSCLQASLASLFIKIYSLDELYSGLIYLPFGIACIIAAFLSGKSKDMLLKQAPYADIHSIRPAT